MNYFHTVAAYGTTGTKTINVGFQPRGMRITSAQRSTNNDNLVRSSDGKSDGTTQSCQSQYYDGSSGGSGLAAVGPLNFIDRIVSMRNRSAGTVSEVFSAHIDSSTAPWTSTEVKFIIDIATSAYPITIEVWGD